MKKLLGISLVAVLAATPLMARADDVTLLGTGEQHTIATTTDVATTSYVQGAYNALGTVINTKADKSALSAEATARAAADDALDGRLDTAEGKLDVLNGDATTNGSVAKKIADAISEVNTDAAALAGRVTAAEGDIDALETSVATKAAQADLTALTGRVTAAEGDIDALEASVATKAAQADLTALTGRVTTAEGDISAEETRAKAAEQANASAIAEEVTARQNAISGEASARAEADTALGQRIDALNTSMTGDFATKTGVAATVNAATATGSFKIAQTWGSETAIDHTVTSDVAVDGYVAGAANNNPVPPVQG